MSHSKACVEVSGPKGFLLRFDNLPVEKRRAILACPHWSHDSVRWFFDSESRS